MSLRSVHVALQSNATAIAQSAVTPYYFDLVVIVGIAILLLIFIGVLICVSKGNQDDLRALRHSDFERAHGKSKEAMRDSSEFFIANGYSFDFILAMKAVLEDDQKEDFVNSIKEQHRYPTKGTTSLFAAEVKDFQDSDVIMKILLRRLRFAGLEYYLCFSIQQDEVYIKIRAPLPRLQREADRTNCYLRLSGVEARKRLETGTEAWEPVIYLPLYFGTKLDPFSFIYANYDMDPKFTALFASDDKNRNGDAALTERNVFTDKDRINLIFSILQTRNFHKGAHLELSALKNKGIMWYFPLHNHTELDPLELSWLRLFAWPWHLPLDGIRDYFGERLGMYFAFQAHYTTWLFVAAAGGLLAWVNVAQDENNPSAADIPYYSGMMALWATLFLEFWKRKQKRLAMEWGVTQFEEEERERPGFEGESLKSPVDNLKIVYFPAEKRFYRLMVSAVIIVSLLSLALAIIGSILLLRIVLLKVPELNVNGILLGDIIASLLNTIQIIIGNLIFSKISKMLTEYENHRTDTEFEDNLIMKTFGFQFINSYATLFYVAFAKSNIGDLDHCVNYDCMQELRSTLGTLFISKIVVNVLTNALVPFINQKLKERENFKGHEDRLHAVIPAEREFMLTEFDELLGSFEDYSADAIQFGYLTMFISAFPLASLMCLVNNYIMIRVNAWTMCHVFRRPIPKQAEDIGSWYFVFDFLGIAAVIVNSALVAFTSTITKQYNKETRVWIFVGMAAFIVLCKQVVQAIVPDTPEDVATQLQRQTFIVDKLIFNAADDNSWKASGANHIEMTMEDKDMEMVDLTDNKPY